VPQAGISGARLDDVRDPFLARWEALYGRFISWFREIYHGASGEERAAWFALALHL
jgi:hypothetical protein